MEATFKRDEIISATSAAKNFGKVVSDLANHRKALNCTPEFGQLT